MSRLNWQTVALGALGLAALDAVIGTKGQQTGAPGRISSLFGSLASIPRRIVDPATGILTASNTPTPGAASSDALVGSLSASALPASGPAAGVLAEADRWARAHVPYQWGGASPAGADCSGFVQTVYADNGIGLPRTSWQQAAAGSPVAEAGVEGLANARPGDLVFFGSNSHVGIYAGNGLMFDEPHTGGHAEEVPVYGTPDAIRNVLGAPAGPTVTV